MINDTELLKKIAENDDDAFLVLCDKYEPLTKSLIRKFSHTDMTHEDIEDLEQEIKILLFKAARTYDVSSGLTFGLYASICIRNRLVSLARKEKSEVKKVSADVGDLLIALPDTTWSIVEAESADILMAKIKTVLSPKEYEVFGYMILDYKNSQIASELGIASKSVDNTVFRIKKKLRALLL